MKFDVSQWGMKWFRLRILWISALLFALGIALYKTNANWLWIIAGIFVVGFIVYSIKMKKWTYLLFIPVILSGFFRAEFALVPETTRDTSIDYQKMHITGKVDSDVVANSAQEKYTLVLRDVTYLAEDGKKGQWAGNVRLTITGKTHIGPEDEITAYATVFNPEVAKNPGQFDARDYYYREGIMYFAAAKSEDAKILSKHTGFIFRNITLQIRNQMMDTINTYLDGTEAELMISMILGCQRNLPEQVQEDFRRTGVIHILSVSGLHVGFVILALGLLLGALKTPRKARFAIMVTFLLLYCAVVQFSPTVVRASIMAVVFLGAGLLGRKYDMLTSLGTAALVILLISPLDIYDIGFQLSFGAVLGIALFEKRLTSFIATFFPKWLAQSISITLSAQIAILPVLAYYFNEISVISICANVVIVPISGIAIITGFVLVAFGWIAGFIGIVFGTIAQIVNYYLLLITAAFSDIPFAMVKVSSPQVVWIFGFILLLLFVSRYYTGKKRTRGLIMGLLAFLLVVSSIAPVLYRPNLRIAFLSIGNADCAVITTQEGKNYLVDAGGSDWTADSVIVPYLRKMGIDKLDGIFISHAHNDHDGALAKLLQKVIVEKIFYFPGMEDDDYVQACAGSVYQDIKREPFVYGDDEELDSRTDVHVLWPTAYEGGDMNAYSTVLRLETDDFSTLFTGDLTKTGENGLMKVEALDDVDVLKVGHHGSVASSGGNFLKALSPSWAIVSTGPNSYGHPSAEVLKRLQAIGAQCFRTDDSGAIWLDVIGSNVQVHTFLEEKFK